MGFFFLLFDFILFYESLDFRMPVIWVCFSNTYRFEQNRIFKFDPRNQTDNEE